MFREEDIQKVLDKDIDILVNGLLQELQEYPKAIFLCGSYGRGEGAWLEDKDGKPMPFNDFDLAIITDDPLNYFDTEKLRKELARKVNIRWIDIDYYSDKALSAMKPTIHNVDLLYASRCIYGDADALKKYGPLNAAEIGYLDFVILYKTRMWTLLGSWEGEFHDLTVNEAVFFRNQMVKATLAACDFLLVKNHKYQTSYKGRAELVCQLFVDNKELCNRVCWAIGEKLRPTQSSMPKDEIIALYNECKRIFLWAASMAFGENWKFYFNPDLTLANEKSGRPLWKRMLITIYYKLKHQTNLSIKSSEIFAAQNYVLWAEKEGTFNKTYIQKASEILLKWGYIQQPNHDWYQLHNIVADARNNI